ncbi:hypothetical protein HN51_024867 [Arachis hypogaea]
MWSSSQSASIFMTVSVSQELGTIRGSVSLASLPLLNSVFAGVDLAKVENKIELSSKNTKALFYASPVLARHVENLSNLVMNNSNLDGLTEEERNKYGVNPCGYCPEVQVGLEGHKLRMRKASKHQSRNGLHVWQEATIDDLVGPNYVWHVDDLNGSPLNNNLKRYYGKAPAVVELCVHGGALVPNQYKSMMRLDVVSPDRDEVDLVA